MWVDYHEGEVIGWNSLIFESHDTIKFANAYVKEEYRGKGIYTKLWNARMEFCKQTLRGGMLLPIVSHIWILQE